MAKTSMHADAVVDGIYAAILESASVDDMQRLLCRTLDAPASSMSRVDGGVAPLSWIGFDSGTSLAYRDHYCRIDPWIAAGMTVPEGTGTNVERLVPRDQYLRGAFYNDFMRANGDATQLLGVMFAADVARYSLTFARVAGQRDFDDAQERRFASWSPHLRRAFATRDRLNLQDGRSAGLNLLAKDADAVHVLVNADLVVRWISGHGLTAIPGVVLRPRPAGPLRLEAQACEVQSDLLRTVHDATGRHPRLSGAVRLGHDFILVDPCLWADGGEALALLHIPNRRAVEARAIERATGVFHLTGAEAALCNRMMHGDTVEVHAEAMGLSPWTVRTHLRNVFAKTGTSRQAELVALLHRLAR